MAFVVAGAVSTQASAQGQGLETQQLQRQQERERQLRSTFEPASTPPAAALARPPAPQNDRLPVSESPCSVIEDITLDGRMAERFGWLPAAAAGAAGDDSPFGRCIGEIGIALVLSRLQEALIQRGFVTSRPLAGQQDRATGHFKVTLVPGTIRDIRLAPGSSPRAGISNALPARPGDLLQLRDLEQGVENFKRVPTAEAEIVMAPPLAPDALPGESDLEVRYQQQMPLRLNLAFDDGGTRATGKQQGTATLSYDNWWTLNDLFYINLGHSLSRADEHGTRAATVHYSLPWGYWLFGVTASRNRYFQSVAGASQTYVFSGSSETAELSASRVVWRDATGKTTTGLRTFRRSAASFIDDTEIEVQHRVTAGWEASLAHREQIGDAVLDASLAYRRGTGAYGALPAPEEAFGEGTSRMKVATGDLSFSKPFTVADEKLRYATSWRAQWNRTPLSPQDRFALGGRYTVRGFDGESALLAERGWFWRNELIGQVWGGQQAYIGVDTGRVGGPSADFLVGKSLTGAVLGMRGAVKAVSYDVFVGRPLRKPEGFVTGRVTVGFNLVVGF